MSRRCMLAVLVTLSALVAVPTSASAAVPSGYYGMNAQFVWTTPPSAWEPHLASIAAAGINTVRVDAPWGFVEPTAPVGGVRKYHWYRLDGLVEALAKHNLRWYPILAYGTIWSATVEGSWMSPPQNPADYAAFVEAFARRYGTQGTFWAAHPELPRLPVAGYEIWNEPNVEHFFQDQSTAPERYADLFVPAAAAAERGDPQAHVLIGGLSSTNVESFLTRMTAHRPELWSHVDAVSYHPYGGNPTITYERLDIVRNALAKLGVGHLPLEITETGLATPPTTEERRTDVMRQLTEEFPRSNCGITRFIPYTWRTKELSPTDPEDWFGIANADGSLKPTGVAYRDALQRMRGIQPGAPTAPVGGCTGAGAITPTPGKPGKPGKPRRVALSLRLRAGRLQAGARHLRVSARCTTRCRLTLRLVGRKRGANRSSKRSGLTVGHASMRINGRRTLHLRVRRTRLARLRGGRLRLEARASDGQGRRVSAARPVAR